MRVFTLRFLSIFFVVFFIIGRSSCCSERFDFEHDKDFYVLGKFENLITSSCSSSSDEKDEKGKGEVTREPKSNLSSLLKNTDFLKDLDAKHQHLGSDEKGIKGNTDTDNIVLAAISLVLEDGNIRHKRIPWIFQSAPQLFSGQSDFDREYKFQDTKKPYDDLLNYIKSIWLEEREQLQTTIDQEIKFDIEKLDKEIKKEIKKHREITQFLLPTIKEKINNFVDNYCYAPEDLLSNKIFELPLSKEIDDLFRRSLESLKLCEKKIVNLLEKLNFYYWHSEQRLVNYLSSEKSNELWDSLLAQHSNNQPIGIFLHVHSRNNFCRVCRRTLIRSVQPGGKIYEKIKSKISNDFSFRILGSFRILYAWKPRNAPDSSKIWMPFTHDQEDMNGADIFNKHTMLCKRIELNPPEEIESTRLRLYYEHLDKREEQRRGPAGMPGRELPKLQLSSGLKSSDETISSLFEDPES